MKTILIDLGLLCFVPALVILFRAFDRKEWVGLTDEEIDYCVKLKNPEAIAEEVEAKLKEKNND